MKAIILYYSKYGACESLARQIQTQLACDIAPISSSIEIEAYDTVIIGASVYIGMLNKKVKEFVSNYTEELKSKRVFMFTSGLSIEQSNQVIQDNLGENFYASLTYSGGLGGAVDFSKLSFFERQIMKVVNKKEHYVNEIKKDTKFLHVNEMCVQRFIQAIRTSA